MCTWRFYLFWWHWATNLLLFELLFLKCRYLRNNYSSNDVVINFLLHSSLKVEYDAMFIQMDTICWANECEFLKAGFFFQFPTFIALSLMFKIMPKTWCSKIFVEWKLLSMMKFLPEYLFSIIIYYSFAIHF